MAKPKIYLNLSIGNPVKRVGLFDVDVILSFCCIDNKGFWMGAESEGYGRDLQGMSHSYYYSALRSLGRIDGNCGNLRSLQYDERDPHIDGISLMTAESMVKTLRRIEKRLDTELDSIYPISFSDRIHAIGRSVNASGILIGNRFKEKPILLDSESKKKIQQIEKSVVLECTLLNHPDLKGMVTVRTNALYQGHDWASMETLESNSDSRLIRMPIDDFRMQSEKIRKSDYWVDVVNVDDDILSELNIDRSNI